MPILYHISHWNAVNAVYRWARVHIRVVESEEELRAKLAEWHAGKPLKGGMTQ